MTKDQKPNPLSLYRIGIDRYDRMISSALLQRMDDLASLTRLDPSESIDFIHLHRAETQGWERFAKYAPETLSCFEALYRIDAKLPPKPAPSVLEETPESETLRNAILGLEKIILHSVKNRLDFSLLIGKHKKKHSLKILDPARKSEIEQKMKEGGLGLFLNFFEALHDLSVKVQTEES